MNLQSYRRKRQFDSTPEPAGEEEGSGQQLKAGQLRFVVQKHAASRLHYDFRLELDGVLKSWAVPKGPSMDPAVKALAVQVEDHPIEYASFEGTIPSGQYGGGTVMLWDHGLWEPEGKAEELFKAGKLKFRLFGEKLSGRWNLVQMHGKAGEDGKNWLLFKSDDEHARPAGEFDVLQEMPRSVASGRTLDEITDNADPDGHTEPGGATKSKDNTEEGRASGVGRTHADDVHGEHEIDASALKGSRRKSMPRTFQPQLATAVRDTPVGQKWVHELKFDGYRLLCRIEDGRTQLITRQGHDWTDRFPRVAKAVARYGWPDAIIDGEVVVLAKDGTTDFQALQNLMRRGRDDDMVYFAFDLPFFNGFDLTGVSLLDRKELLDRLLAAGPSDGVVRYSDHIMGGGPKVFRHACRHSLEGVISKRIDSPYTQRRSKSWVKTKCLKRQEFVLGGWTEPGGSRQGFGALLLGYYQGGRLIYCGRVGTGFTNQSLHDISRQFESLATDKPAFDEPPQGYEARDVHWIQPQLVAEVEFTSWTDDGLLRHASFQGLREDKSPESVVREDATPATAPREAESGKSRDPVIIRTEPEKSSVRSSGAEVSGVRLTNPDRVLYPQGDITKGELAEFYAAISDWILPHLEGRPLTLVRCPKGREGQCFYQKHLTESMPESLRGVEVEEQNERQTYVVVDDPRHLILLVQMSVLELHPWPAREDRLDRPDRLIFDLDPGEAVDWKAMIQAAHEVRERLEQFDLQCFLRTTGGKGLHIVAPLVRRTEWDDLKGFARSIADDLEADFPDRYIATASKARRHGKIFVDYLRNQRGATAIASYSTRARAGAPVATPIRWEELNARLKPDAFDVRNLPKRLATLTSDPWAGFFDLKQSISKAALGRTGKGGRKGNGGRKRKAPRK